MPGLRWTLLLNADFFNGLLAPFTERSGWLAIAAFSTLAHVSLFVPVAVAEGDAGATAEASSDLGHRGVNGILNAFRNPHRQVSTFDRSSGLPFRGRILRYESLTAAPVELRQQSGAILVLHCASDGAMWAGGVELARYDADGSETSYLRSLLPKEKVMAIAHPPDGSVEGDVWIATSQRLLHWTKADGLVAHDTCRRRG